MWSCDTWHKLKWKMNASSVFLNSVNLHYLHNCRRWSSTLICHAWSLTILYAICSANVFYCLLLDATHRGMEQIMLTGWRIAFVFYSSAGSEKKNSHKGSSSYCRWLTTYSHAKKKWHFKHNAESWRRDEGRTGLVTGRLSVENAAPIQARKELVTTAAGRREL